MKKKNVLIITAICIIVALIFAMVFISLKGKNQNGNDVGEVYFHKTELEHIKSSEDGTLYADDEILLVASGDAKFKDIEKLAKNNDAEIVGYIEQTGDYQLQFNKVYTVDELEEIVSVFKQNELIVDAYVNYAFVTSETKTEERNGFIYGDKWEKDLQNFNDCKGKSWGIEAIETLAAWDVLNLYKSKVNPVKVGLLDNGFDTAHEDLGFVETFYNTSAENHGTHVAGTMAAKTNNDQGICGVYPYGDGNLYGVSATGVGSYSENNESFTDIHMTSMGLKIAYAELILRNVSVINTSMGYYIKDILTSMTWEEYTESLEKYDHVLADFLQRCLKKGYDFVLVNAAGNDSDRNNNTVYDSKYNSWAAVISKEDYPEVYDRIIIVGASDSDGNICNFSNGGDRVDIYAPGDEVYSTMVNSKYGNTYKENGNEYYWSGTSMAAPHVSGVAAMVWSLNNNLTGAQVKEIVCSSHNSRYSSCDVVDAYIATQKAASTLGLSNNKNSNNGGILCWVVSASDDETKISNATVTAVNMQTNEKFTTTTDDLGHFELFVPAGKYTLTVHAEGYNDFAWPNEKEPYTNPISVENNKVNYLNDWIKMDAVDAVTDEKEEDSENNAQLLKSESELKIIAETYGKVSAWGYADYDGDGKSESFAVITNEEQIILKTLFISSEGDVSLVEDNLGLALYTSEEGNVRHKNGKSFFWADMGAYGSGWQTILYSVKNGYPYKLQLSNKIQGFYEENDKFYTTENEFLPEGGHLYPKIELIYDANAQEFKKGNKIEDVNNLNISLEDMEIVSHDCYKGNQGDSTVYKAKDGGNNPFSTVYSHFQRYGSNSGKIISIDISEWMTKISDKNFRDFLSVIDDHMGENIIVFHVPFVEKEILNGLRNGLGDVLFVRDVSFVPFDHLELTKCAEESLAKRGFTMEDDAWDVFHARITEEKNDGRFYGINTVNKVIREMIYRKQLDNALHDIDDTVIKKSEILGLASSYTEHEKTGLELLDDFIGMESIRARVEEIVAQIEMSAENNNLGSPCIHMRFVGNPGTGKTTVARVIGKILKEKGILRNGNFFEYAGRDFCGRYVGETAPKTAAMCRDAYGSVLFIDEAYSLYRGDGYSTVDYGREAIDTLIAEMENHRSDLVVIMAGYIDEMNNLMKANAGLESRMPYIIKFPNYTREQLCDIFMLMVKKNFKYQEGFERAVKYYFKSLPDEVVQSKEFSNARFVRNLFERTWGKAVLRAQLNKEDSSILTKEDFLLASSEKEFKKSCLNRIER